MESKAGDSDRGDGDLGELEPLRHQGLVVAVGELAAEPGQEEERRDQGRAGERDQGFGIGARHLEQDDEDQRGLEEVVAECREELAPEQGRETSRRSSGTWTWLSPLASQATTSQATLARRQSSRRHAAWRRGIEGGARPAASRLRDQGDTTGAVGLAPAYRSIAPAPLARRWARRYRGGSMAMASTS